MLNTKMQTQSFLRPGQEVFYNICAWQPSCSIVRNHLNQWSSSFRQKAHVKSGKIVQEVSEKKTFKDFMILYMYIAKGQGQITHKILTVAKRF